VTKATDQTRTPQARLDSFQQVLKVAFELHNAGRHAEAEAACRILMDIHPRDGQLLFLLGMVLHQTNRSAEARPHLELAAELQPQMARVFNGLGHVHQKLHHPLRAVEYYARAVELGMQSADLFYSMGNACHELGDMERAVTLFERAVALNPRDASSWNNLGKCLKECHRLEESIRAYDRGLAADPNCFMAHYGRAIALLMTGRLPEGFREYNRWRNFRITPRQFPQPLWQGEPIPGRTLFLHAEQGYGDAIQYARFIPQARECCGRVILECRPELKALFTHSGCAGEVIAYGEAIPPFDYYTSLISLPGILGVTLETIPRQVPYLKAAADGRLPPAPAGHLKVGVAWAGNPDHHNDAARSLGLAELAPLFQAPNAVFYSLQVTVPPRDEAVFGAGLKLVDLRGRLKDFLDTAAAVAELDLVIAVDTSVAHLAGALAKPVWTLLPYTPDWRWLMARSDSPWYPTMRLFRQAQRGQWPPVIRQVAEALEHFPATHPR
jgi:tetratricopeptide (TPR) repeat protein